MKKNVLGLILNKGLLKNIKYLNTIEEANRLVNIETQKNSTKFLLHNKAVQDILKDLVEAIKPEFDFNKNINKLKVNEKIEFTNPPISNQVNTNRDYENKKAILIFNNKLFILFSLIIIVGSVFFFLRDNKAPEISLNGADVIEVEKGTTYIEHGISCIDNSTQECIVNINGVVDVNVVGTYDLEYVATDSNGNTSDSIIRKVIVKDTIVPIIFSENFIKSSPYKLVVNEKIKSYSLDNGYTWFHLDNEDTEITLNLHKGTYEIIVVDSYDNKSLPLNLEIGHIIELNEIPKSFQEQLEYYDIDKSGGFTTSELKSIKSIDLSLSNIIDISFISNFTYLEDLSIDYTQVSDLTPISNLTNLKELYLFSTNVSDLTPLSNLINLKKLVLDNTQVSDLTPLSNLTNLETLYLFNTNVSDLSPLSNLIKLKKLHLGSTQVANLIPLDNLVSLEEMYLDYTNISDLSPLTFLPKLKYLNLKGNNNINDFFLLLEIENLEFVDLQDIQYEMSWMDELAKRLAEKGVNIGVSI